jgi:23S rRNA pseudouridine1911/1915/1917 synthase
MNSTKLIVGSGHAGWRLDRFIAALVPTLSRTRIQSLIRSQHILLQGIAVKPGEKICAGQEVYLLKPPQVVTPELIPESGNLHILYEDKDLLIINKEAGIAVHPGAGMIRGTLAGILLAHCTLSKLGGSDRPGIVHRLDKETSGCLVVAKNDVAHQALSRQFALRAVEKVYLAIVQGILKKSSGVIEAPIRRHPIHRKKMAIARPSEGREAVTFYRLLAVDAGMSLLECRPKTGRTHQIRVHLQHIHHPILGDPLYGKRGRFQRHLLHAWKLSLTHPTTGSWMEFCAPPPADFAPNFAGFF